MKKTLEYKKGTCFDLKSDDNILSLKFQTGDAEDNHVGLDDLQTWRSASKGPG